jgi:N-acetylneuraminate synthase
MNSNDGVFIIGEAGVNHNGSLRMARKLIDIGAAAGVDAVKFQSFGPERLLAVDAQKAQYQKKCGPAGETQYQMLKRYCLSQEDQKALWEHCRARGVQFLSSPFGIEDADFLASLGMRIFKIPSGEITNLPLLRRIARLRIKIFLSTGMCTLREVETALKVLFVNGARKKDIALLHCTSEYPAPFEHVNLRAMVTLRDRFNVPVGYSDHTPGIEVAIAAVALGARVIEKHFTTDKNLPGPDHASSLNETELRNLVVAIRKVQTSLGSSAKRPSPVELMNRTSIRKCIVARRMISKGEAFSDDNITAKRPFIGLSPMQWDRVIGRKARKAFIRDEPIIL